MLLLCTYLGLFVCLCFQRSDWNKIMFASDDKKAVKKEPEAQTVRSLVVVRKIWGSIPSWNKAKRSFGLCPSHEVQSSYVPALSTPGIITIYRIACG
jgi:hypothetical protein